MSDSSYIIRSNCVTTDYLKNKTKKRKLIRTGYHDIDMMVDHVNIKSNLIKDNVQYTRCEKHTITENDIKLYDVIDINNLDTYSIIIVEVYLVDTVYTINVKMYSDQSNEEPILKKGRIYFLYLAENTSPNTVANVINIQFLNKTEELIQMVYFPEINSTKSEFGGLIDINSSFIGF